jgi:hypothetical protein
VPDRQRAGYALADYGLGSTFNMLEETSGPPFTHIDRGCLCNYPKEPTVCGQGLISECFGHDAQMFVDRSYDNTKCSQAEKTHHSFYPRTVPARQPRLPGAPLVYPTTDIHFVFGGLDTSGAAPAGLDWANLITPKAPPTVDCVADAPTRTGGCSRWRQKNCHRLDQLLSLDAAGAPRYRISSG